MLTSAGMILPCILDGYQFKSRSTVRGFYQTQKLKGGAIINNSHTNNRNLAPWCLQARVPVCAVQMFADKLTPVHLIEQNDEHEVLWCRLAGALIDNEMSHWSQNVVAEQQGGRQLNQITGLSASTDKQPQAWLNWEK